MRTFLTLLAFLCFSSSALAKVHTFTAVRDREGVATFKLKGIKAEQLVSAQLIFGSKVQNLNPKLLKAAIKDSKPLRINYLKLKSYKPQVSIPDNLKSNSSEKSSLKEPKPPTSKKDKSESKAAKDHKKIKTRRAFAPRKVKVVTDTTPPETSITAGPSEGSTLTAASTSFAFTGSDNTGITGYECRLGSASFASCVSPVTYSNLSNGTHTFYVRAKDKYGNYDQTPATRSFNVQVSTSSEPTTSTSLCKKAASPTLQKQTTWRALGSLPISDQEAANKTVAQSERRPENFNANNYCSTDAEIGFFHSAPDQYGQTETSPGSTFNIYRRYVSGRFVGTTDEIISWAAIKWGIPEDWLRAQYVTESWWRHSTMGDRATVADPTLYPAFSRITGTSDVYLSLGLTQVKWKADKTVHNGTEPLRWKSTAFNVDYQAATVRYYYDDPENKRSNWSDSTYVKGDAWLSIGGWYSPYPWNNAGQQSYVKTVQDHLAKRTWEQPGF